MDSVKSCIFKNTVLKDELGIKEVREIILLLSFFNGPSKRKRIERELVESSGQKKRKTFRKTNKNRRKVRAPWQQPGLKYVTHGMELQSDDQRVEQLEEQNEWRGAAAVR